MTNWFTVERIDSDPQLGVAVINVDNNLITAAKIGRIIWIIQIIKGTTNTAENNS